MFEAGQKVELVGTEIRGVVLGQSPKHWWPDLTGCYRVEVQGHGVFNFPGSELSAT